MALFEHFGAAAVAAGFELYPESCGHDLVMVAGPNVVTGYRPGGFDCDIEPGDRIAVEGKLHANLQVLSQALPPWSRWYPPTPRSRSADFYAVLVPEVHNHEFYTIARAVGVGVIVWPGVERARGGRSDGLHWLSEFQSDMRAPVWAPLDLPLRVAGVRAGSPAPRSVSKWKVDAVRLCLLALGRADRSLRTSDFLGTAVVPSRFAAWGWMEKVGREGKEHVYELRDLPTRPDLRYPEVVDAIRENERAAAPRQGALL